MRAGADPLLMTPGPTRIPRRVLEAGTRVLHHRTEEFSGLLAELLGRLAPLFGTAAAHVLPVHATGRAAMEGAIANFFVPGDRVVCCCNGKFGEMWAGFAEGYGLDVVRVATSWDRSVDPDEVAAALGANGGARALTVAYSDTSTGVLNPVPEIAALGRAHGVLVLVDAISALGGTPFRMDDWGVDFAVTSSQKCLMSSPGLSFAAVGPRAWEATGRGGFPRSYWDFGRIREALVGPRPETPGTTPVALVLQVLEALRLLGEEGWETVFERHRAMAEELRTRASEAGFLLQGAAVRERSPTLTALVVPEGVEPGRVRAALLARGIRIAGGLGPYLSTGLRVGHMGDIRMEDVRATAEALAEAVVAVGGRA